MIEKYKPLFIFIILTIIFFLIGAFGTYAFTSSKMLINKFWIDLTILDTATAIALAVLAFMTYMEYARNEDEIELKVAIYDDAKSNSPEIKDFYEIAGNKVKVLRKEVNRSEIMGILGMFQRDMKTRFEMKDNKLKILFLENLKKIQKGEGNILIIPVLKEDYENFLNPTVIENKEEKQ